MNEQIQLLAKQAGIIGQSETDVAPPMERFAELIIEECAKQAEYNGYNQMFGKGGLRSKLHEYFGVKK
jgi:hypothetical protein